MLQSIREKAQGWIAWAIVVLISIPFALFGIQEYLGASANPVVAEVDGAKIKQSELERRVRDARENMRRVLGDSYRADMFQGDAFQQQVLQAMIDESLTRQASEKWNMRISDAQIRAFIRSMPQFQSNGAFSMQLYEAGVRNRGMNSTGFEALVRQELVQQQLQAGVRNTVLVTDAELDEQIRLAQQRRNVTVARIPAADYNQPETVSDEQARAYYKAHPADYTVPERVKLAYLRIDSAALAPQVEVTDAALKDYFEQHKDEFVAPQERRVRHILIAANADNDVQQKAKAEAILKQLQDGADFAKLAKADSEDEGSAKAGGDLGWVSHGMMVKPFEQAVFSLKPDQLSGLVKTRYGYHIIEVTGVRGGGKADFDAVRPEVEAAYRKHKAEDLYYDKYERLADAVYENPDSLQPAAELLGLKVQHTDWVNRDGKLPGELDNPKVISAAFSDDVLQSGNNSDVIELAPADAVALRVADHEPERVKPFEDVKDKVIAEVAKNQASDRAAEVGRKALQQLKDGESLASLAKQKDWKTEQAEIGRDSSKLPAESVAEAFSIGMPEGAKRGDGGVVSAEGDYLLIEVTGVTEGDPDKLAVAAKQSQRAELQSQDASAQFTGLVDDLRQRAEITLSKKE